mmetsp:Transcript_633/g.2449  ORF Transcript_633/g.2449 Transcript_633/m.2449 type:complete len:253 (-) Transcript_633:1218-1976(-)
MAPVHGLHVLVGVPVRVVDDDRVRGGEVDAQPARARRQQEDAVLLIIVEALDALLARRLRDTAVDAEGVVAALLEEVAQQVQHFGHLRKHEHLVVALAQVAEQPVNQLHLAAVVEQLLHWREEDVLLEGRGDEVGVVGVLAELHDRVAERRQRRARVHGLLLAHDRLEGLLRELLVEVGLHGGHVSVQDDFLLLRQVFRHLGFEPAQHKWPHDVVQLLHHQVALLVDRVRVEVEPALEVVQAAEDVGHDEVE